IRVANDAWPAQHVEHAQSSHLPRNRRSHLARPRQHVSERLRIELERSLGALGRAMRDAAVDLTALELVQQCLTQVGFKTAQLLGQPEPGLEEAVIHAAQLADQRAPWPRVFA